MNYGQTLVDGSFSDYSGAGLTDWSGWFRDVSGQAVKAALGAYTYRNVIQPGGGIPAVGPNGEIYYEGQRAAMPVSIGGVSTGVLLLAGAALVAVLLLKR